MTASRRSPWPAVAAIAALAAVAWPPDGSRSLALKTINWLADPRHELPRRPSPLAIGVDDDADIVTAHDDEEHAYEAMSRRSAAARLRLQLHDAEDPLDPSTERPLIVAAAAIAAVWALRRRASP